MIWSKFLKWILVMTVLKILFMTTTTVLHDLKNQKYSFIYWCSCKLKERCFFFVNRDLKNVLTLSWFWSHWICFPIPQIQRQEYLINFLFIENLSFQIFFLLFFLIRIFHLKNKKYMFTLLTLFRLCTYLLFIPFSF